MKYELKYLLHICGCVVRGDAPEAPDERLDLGRFFALASDGDVAALAGYGMNKVCMSFPDAFSDEERTRIDHAYNAAKKTAMSSMVSREALISLMDDMRADGFEAAVYKGMAAAECYDQPYLRRSGDIDLYMEARRERALYKWLEARGFEVTKRAAFANHSKAVSPDAGYLEVHTAVFADRLTDRWRKLAKSDVFTTPQKPFITVSGSQGRFVTFDITEHFLYIFLHFVKHHITLEGDLKMLCDINAYAWHYRNSIDWTYTGDILGKLGYIKLLCCMLDIGRLYMGFEAAPVVAEEDCGIEDEGYVRVLDDLAGILSQVSENKPVSKAVKEAYWSQVFASGGAYQKLMFFIKGKLAYYLRFLKKHSLKDFGTAVRSKLSDRTAVSGAKDTADISGSSDSSYQDAASRCLDSFRKTGLM